MSGNPTDEKLEQRVTKLAMRVSQCHQAEKGESESWYRSIYENSLDGIMLTMPAGPILRANRTACEILGYTEAELRLLGRGGVVDASDPRLPEKLAERTRTGRFAGELTFIRKDGVKIFCEVSSSIFKEQDGLEFNALIFRDISARKLTEETLRNTERRLQAILDNIPVLISFFDQQGRFRWMNSCAEQTLGWSSDEGVQEDLFAWCYPDLEYRKCVADFIASGSGRWGEFKTTTRDGRVLEMMWTAVRLADESTVGIGIDITERKRSEEALREREETFKAIVDQSAEGVVLIDAETLRFLEFNDAACHQLGYSREEFAHRTLLDIQTMSREQVEERVRKIVESGSAHFDNQQRRKDGAFRDVSVSNQVIRLRGRTCLAGIWRDITERKRDEEALRETEERFHKIFHSSPVALSLSTFKEGRYLDVNDEFLRLSERTREEVIGHTASEMNAWTHLGHRESIISKQKEDGKIRNLELELRSKSGRKVQVLWSAEEVVIGGETRLLVSAQDITERRLAEEALLSLSSRQQALLSAIPDIVMEVDSHRIYTWANQAGFDFFGEDVIGKEAAHYFEGEQETDALMEPLFNGEEKVIYVESWQRRKDGESRLLAWWCKVLKDEDGNVIGALSSARDVTDRQRAETELKASEGRFRKVFEEGPLGMVLTSRDLKLFRVNPAFCRMLGYTIEEMSARTFLDVTHPEHRDLDKENVEKLWRGEIPHYSTQKRYLTKNGEIRWGSLSASLIREGDGKALYALAMIEDITNRKNAEEEREKLQAQFLQAQKMESVGRLAGGVAHDFNNMIGIIMGNAEMAALQVSPNGPVLECLQEIIKASHRSADTARQLLAFARKQTINPKVLDLNDTIAGMLRMLQRLIGEDIDLGWHPGHVLWNVKIDPSQVSQILANLAVNARDAIAGVGKVTIGTDNVTLDQAYCAAHEGFVPGEYVLMALSDNGAGMPKEVLGHLFEPFFTTKGVGKGTGLGLATLYGIVKQNNGFIDVYSEPGQGTTFKIYFPRCEGESVKVGEKVEEKLPRGTETILIAEDEAPLLNIARGILTMQGYTVLAATTPTEALSLADRHQSEIHLLLTDVVMPEMNGRALMEKLHTRHPGMKSLFMSGYTADVVAHHGVLDEGVHFIEKPFSPRLLAVKVREVLDTPSS